MEHSKNMKISEGLKEDGIVVGNNYDKYASSNPIVKWMMKGFHDSLDELLAKSNPSSVHEVGCGEGYWTLQCSQEDIDVRGSDFSETVIEIAKQNAAKSGFSPDMFEVNSIYDLCADKDSADLIVCCEVLEHIDDPEAGLKKLQEITTRNIILSVPREPIWCMLNLMRGKYISSFGNTPGHIQHWSKSSFIELVSKYFDVVDVRSPFPWTMLYCEKR